MLEKTDFIELGLFFMETLIAGLLWIIFKSPLAVVAGSVGLIALIKFIYEHKTQKENNLIIPVGFYFILLFQTVLIWAYNTYLSFIFGLVGTLSFIGLIYKNIEFKKE